MYASLQKKLSIKHSVTRVLISLCLCQSLCYSKKIESTAQCTDNYFDTKTLQNSAIVVLKTLHTYFITKQYTVDTKKLNNTDVK